jgi:hypothetical protein
MSPYTMVATCERCTHGKGKEETIHSSHVVYMVVLEREREREREQVLKRS